MRTATSAIFGVASKDTADQETVPVLLATAIPYEFLVARWSSVDMRGAKSHTIPHVVVSRLSRVISFIL